MVNNIVRCIVQMWKLRHAEAKEPAKFPEQTTALQDVNSACTFSHFVFCLYDLQAPFLIAPAVNAGICLLFRPYFRPNSIWTHVLTGSFLPTRSPESKINKSTHAQELSRWNVERDHSRLKWLKWQKVKCEWSEWITKACMNSTQVKQIQYQFNFWPRAEGKARAKEQKS